MTTELLVSDVWTRLRAASRGSRRPADVAVAYFSDSGSRLLQLPRGSRLVVDASLAAVKAGMTSPAALLRLVRRGVDVYSVSNLHAKVFVLGNRAFVGSGNASRTSAEQLIEAMVSTSDRAIVAAARRFVRSLCLEALTPQSLEVLGRSYRPPVGSRTRRARTRTASRSVPATAPLRVVQLTRVELTDAEAALAREGLESAKAAREHGRGWEIQSYRLHGRCHESRHDLVIQVVHEGGGRRLVEPPGKVVSVVRRRLNSRSVAVVHVEVPKAKRRARLELLARRIGRGALRALQQNGLVRDQEIANRVLRYWAQ